MTRHQLFRRDNAVVRVGDCRDVLDDYPDNTFTSVVTDPPYGISFMSKGWDKDVPGSEYWERVLRVAKPGASMLCFAGTRTLHRMGTAIEESGWVIRDCIMWVYGSGFPKSHNISKAVDKVKGAKFRSEPAKGVGFMNTNDDGWNNTRNRLVMVSEKSADGKLWDGYGTALKPAWEPVILAMKPLDGSFSSNALNHGVGGLNIDGCRVGYGVGGSKPRYIPNNKNNVYGSSMGGGDWVNVNGRWPANFVLSHSEGCKLVGYKTVEGKVINRFKDGAKPFGGGAGHPYDTEKFPDSSVPIYDCVDDCPVGMVDFQGSGVSRFFYTTKANKRERGDYNKHPTVKPLAMMNYLIKLVTMPRNNLILDPFSGSGSTLISCSLNGVKSVGVELDRNYAEIARKRFADRGLAVRVI